MSDFAFLLKAYDSDLLGGGETLVREYSRRLAGRGYKVEILTTCIRDYRDWRDVHPPGLSRVDDIPVRRFPAWQGGARAVYRDLSYRIGNRLAHSQAEGYEWFRLGLHSPALYEYLQGHGSDYRLVILLDYFVSLSLYALMANSGRTAVYPLLHNEPFAYLPAVRRCLNAAHGIMFNGPAERDFARFELGVSNPHTAIVGVGVETRLVGQGDRFRQKFGVSDPFLLYVGRWEMAKNLPALIAYFTRYQAERGTPLKLVLLGKGPLRLPAHPDILPLGYCAEQDKFDAYAAALALCQPSLLESLSIVALEALAQKTPILAHGLNAATRHHCLAGNAGLYFYAYRDFARALDFLQAQTEIRRKLGENGRRYVLENYAWEITEGRFLDALDRFKA